MAYTLDNLRTDIRGYTEVDNGATTPKVLTDSVLGTIIKNAENGIYRQIDTDQNVFYATSNAIIGNRYVTIPENLRAIRYVQFTDSAGNQYYLEQRDTSFMAEYYSTPSTQAVDIPKYYANWDDFNILVAPVPATALEIQINYIKDPPEFTSTNQTFIAKYQESMLLHGVLAEAFRFLKGPMDMYNLYEKKYNEEVQNFALQQMGRRRRAEYDDGVPRVQIPSPPPNTN